MASRMTELKSIEHATYIAALSSRKSMEWGKSVKLQRAKIVYIISLVRNYNFTDIKILFSMTKSNNARDMCFKSIFRSAIYRVRQLWHFWTCPAVFRSNYTRERGTATTNWFCFYPTEMWNEKTPPLSSQDEQWAHKQLCSKLLVESLN